MRHAHDVVRMAQIDSLFALDGKLVDGSVAQPYPLDPVAQRPGGHGDAVPHRRPLRARDTGAEAHAAIRAHRIGEPSLIVVRMVVAERVLRLPVKVLPLVKETARLMSGSTGMARPK